MNAVERALGLIELALAGERDLLLTARELDDLRHQLPNSEDDVWLFIRGVASDLDGVPFGPQRQLWAPAALDRLDKQINEWRSRIEEELRETLVAVAVSLSSEE